MSDDHAELILNHMVEAMWTAIEENVKMGHVDPGLGIIDIGMADGGLDMKEVARAALRVVLTWGLP